MDVFIELLKSMLIPTNAEGTHFALKRSEKREGFCAKFINHSAFDLSKLEATLQSIKPDWKVLHFEASKSFDQKTGKPMSSPERLYFGPSKEIDETDEILNLFG